MRTHRLPLAWIPAFAGMTGLEGADSLFAPCVDSRLRGNDGGWKVRNQRFPLAWIPAFAGMTGVEGAGSSFSLRLDSRLRGNGGRRRWWMGGGNFLGFGEKSGKTLEKVLRRDGEKHSIRVWGAFFRRAGEGGERVYWREWPRYSADLALPGGLWPAEGGVGGAGGGERGFPPAGRRAEKKSGKFWKRSCGGMGNSIRYGGWCFVGGGRRTAFRTGKRLGCEGVARAGFRARLSRNAKFYATSPRISIRPGVRFSEAGLLGRRNARRGAVPVWTLEQGNRRGVGPRYSIVRRNIHAAHSTGDSADSGRWIDRFLGGLDSFRRSCPRGQHLPL